jgi:hypothetical protein
MTKPIEIDLRRDLPKVREQLEAILPNIGACLYSAPCAIGAMLSERDRKRLAGREADETAIDFHRTIHLPADQLRDAVKLQWAFDSGDVGRFRETLAALEAKYLTEKVS